MKRLCLVMLLSVCYIADMSAESFLVKTWNGFNRLLDYFDESGYDSTYIELPKYRWAPGTELSSIFSSVSIHGDSTVRFTEPAELTWKLKHQYRYLGFSFPSISLKKTGRYYFDLGLTGRKWGFKTYIEQALQARCSKLGMTGDVTQTSFYANVYYVFNNKRFVYSACEGRDIIQKKSAGSLIVGVTYYVRHIAILDTVFQKVLNLKEVMINNGGPSVGYGHNFVPRNHKNWVIHASITPTLTVFSRNSIKTADDQKENPSYSLLSALTPMRLAATYSYKHNDFCLGLSYLMSTTGYKSSRSIDITERQFSFLYRFRF
ncbi:MAG: DUF4421 family protein [Bacteroidales bacterium]|nr:DUF4421 family protein [Bacteroidales bacterium]